MEVNLLDRMLDEYCQKQTPLAITLQNKTRVAGVIRAFDSYVILLKGHKQEIIYRHAVSFLAPSERDDRRNAAPRATAAAPPVAASYPPSTPPRAKSKQPSRVASSPAEPAIGNTMKEGLLKWMEEQKTSGKS